MSEKFLPVAPEYIEQIEKAISKNDTASVNYFENEVNFENIKGKIIRVATNKNNEEFLLFENGFKIRVDRIITINGKPGPAYDEYDSFALACLDCTGGMD